MINRERGIGYHHRDLTFALAGFSPAPTPLPLLSCTSSSYFPSFRTALWLKSTPSLYSCRSCRHQSMSYTSLCKCEVAHTLSPLTPPPFFLCLGFPFVFSLVSSLYPPLLWTTALRVVFFFFSLLFFNYFPPLSFLPGFVPFLCFKPPLLLPLAIVHACTTSAVIVGRVNVSEAKANQ
mmetsp:Transcript_34628/g.89813  ORF Transcript_34628/g.89813 Transcript_34628/m.89813 type:complete len:178 (+) Transcript_34628:2438-2971(+)